MKLPLDVRLLGIEPSPALETAIREKAARLDQVCDDLVSCRVTVESLHKHQQQGHPFAVRIDLTRPGQELAVDRFESPDVHIALRDAFDAMRRKLDDALGRVRTLEKARAQAAVPATDQR